MTRMTLKTPAVVRVFDFIRKIKNSTVRLITAGTKLHVSTVRDAIRILRKSKKIVVVEKGPGGKQVINLKK